MITTILILAVIATLLILTEFFVPGGILGFVGAALVIAIVVLAFIDYGVPGGLAAMVCAALYLIGVIYLFMRFFPESPLGRWAVLNTQVGGSQDHNPELDERKTLAGQTGVAVTVLRPSGIATINGQRLDVVSEGGMIESGQAVVVIKVQGNRIVVRPGPGPAIA